MHDAPFCTSAVLTDLRCIALPSLDRISSDPCSCRNKVMFLYQMSFSRSCQVWLRCNSKQNTQGLIAANRVFDNSKLHFKFQATRERERGERERRERLDSSLNTKHESKD